MKWSKVFATIATMMVLVGILLTIIFTLCFQRSFYQYEYQKNQQAEVIGMSEEDLMNSTDTLLSYLQNQRDDIVVEANVNGVNREVFNERETLHMVDVKNLLNNAVRTRDILLWGGLVVLLIILVKNKNTWVSLLKESYKYALMMIGIFVAMLAIWAIADFNSFWIDFHYLFFDNTLFFLDPNTSIMINMFPESFFFDLVFGIIVVYGAILGAFAMLIHWFVLLQKRRLNTHD